MKIGGIIMSLVATAPENEAINTGRFRDVNVLPMSIDSTANLGDATDGLPAVNLGSCSAACVAVRGVRSPRRRAEEGQMTNAAARRHTA